jgi:hypothetical protein
MKSNIECLKLKYRPDMGVKVSDKDKILKIIKVVPKGKVMTYSLAKKAELLKKEELTTA